MTWFTDLFLSLEGLAKKTGRLEQKVKQRRIQVWEKNRDNAKKRYALAVPINFTNTTIFADKLGFMRLLKQIEATISPELVALSGEEEIEREILADLESLKKHEESRSLANQLADAEEKEKPLVILLSRMCKILKLELHYLRVMRSWPVDVKDIYLNHFRQLILSEFPLYAVFDKTCYPDAPELYKEIESVVKAVIFQEEVKKRVKKEATGFAGKILSEMEAGSKRQYRKLAEAILDGLIEEAGGPFDDWDRGVHQVEQLMKDNGLMTRLVRKLKPKYTPSQVTAVISAFRQFYGSEKFDDLEEEFVD